MTARSDIRKASTSRYRVLRNEWLEPREMLSGQGPCALRIRAGLRALGASTAGAPVSAAPSVAQAISVNYNPPNASLSILSRNSVRSENTLERLSSDHANATSSDSAASSAASKSAMLAKTVADAATNAASEDIAKIVAMNVYLANVQSFLKAQANALTRAKMIIGNMLLFAYSGQNPSRSGAYLSQMLGRCQGQLRTFGEGKFNGIDLFSKGTAASLLTVYTNLDRTSSITISQPALTGQPSMSKILGSGIAIDTTAHATSAAEAIETALTIVIAMYSQNVWEASELNAIQQIWLANLKAASRASESAQLARLEILEQARVAALARANQSTLSFVSLLG